MAEQIRTIEEILRELFAGGQNAALEKYAKVRHTFYEIRLYWWHQFPLEEIDGFAKGYFSKRFLDGKRIDQATQEEMVAALTRLRYAVGDEPCERDGEEYFPGSHGRCLRLVNELNAALVVEGLEPLKDPERFLKFMTFDEEVKRDALGKVIYEHGVPVNVFHDKENRKDFWAEVQPLLKKGKMMPLQAIWVRVLHTRKNSKPIKTPRTPRK